MTLSIDLLLTRRVMILLLLVVLSGVILEIWSVNRLTSFGSQMEKISYEKQSLQLQNQLLENQIAQASSLNQIYSQATSLGFGDNKNIEYLSTPKLALSR